MALTSPGIITCRSTMHARALTGLDLELVQFSSQHGVAWGVHGVVVQGQSEASVQGAVGVLSEQRVDQVVRA